MIWAAGEEGMTGKIIRGIAGFYYVHDRVSRVYACKARGIFRNRKIKPLVGDDVEFEITHEADGEGNIVDILPRKNSLIRPAVANIDQVLLVFAAADPEPNLNLLDRFLVTLKAQGVPVVLCFNKTDLVSASALEELAGIYRGAGYPVLTANAAAGEGLSQIRAVLSGKTTALAGPSGVGKSTLTNLIQPEAGMETGTVSEKIRRGRHTTRHSELFFAGDGTFLMDTPGFSTVFVEGPEPERLQDCFPEFGPYLADCRFLGCVHIGERDCGVKTALAAGKIAPSRYENYKLIYEDLKNQRRY